VDVVVAVLADYGLPWTDVRAALIGAVVAMVLQFLAGLAGFSFQSIFSWALSFFRPEIKCHLRTYDLFRVEEDGTIGRAKVKIRRSKTLRGIRFIYDRLDPTLAVITGTATIQHGHLVLHANFKGDPYMAVFRSSGSGLHRWKIGVFAGIRMVDHSPYAGRTLLCDVDQSVDEADAASLLANDQITLVSKEDQERFIAYFRTKFSLDGPDCRVAPNRLASLGFAIPNRTRT